MCHPRAVRPTLHPELVLRDAARALGLDQIIDIGGDGWDYDTVTALDTHGRTWIMRAARRNDVVPLLIRENAILPHLEIGLLTPKPEKFGTLENGFPCAAYQYIPAEESSAEIISAEATKLAKALHKLHTTPQEIWINHLPTSPSWQERTRKQLEFTATHVEWPTHVLTKWRELLEVSHLWDSPPVLCHGDLGPPHLLSLDGHLVGIIDFSDLEYAPPFVDFGNLLTGFGKEAMLRVLLAYVALSGDNLETLLAASYGYRELGPMYTAFHGINTDQPEFIEEGLARALEIFNPR